MIAHEFIGCLDVQYRDPDAVAGCVVVGSWSAKTVVSEDIERISGIKPYEPGQFYRRELPCLLAVLKRIQCIPGVLVVDGYVYLDEEQRPGLGAKLYAALDRAVCVVGVAKKRFAGATNAIEVYRGGSASPLFVTAAGMSVERAAESVGSMHGAHRLPMAIRRVDRICRDARQAREECR